MAKKKSVFFTASLMVLTLISFNQVTDSGLEITITNLRNNKGHVLICLFKDGEGYPDKPDKAFKKIALPARNNATSILLSDLPSGKYAISILHDENDDQKMNKNFFGIPKEGYGFSKNVIGTFGPPSFSKASFLYHANHPVVLTISTRY